MENKRVSKQIQELEEDLAQANSVQSRIDALNNLAWKLRISHYERAQSLGNEAFELSRSGDYTQEPYCHGLAASLVTLAFLDSELGLLESAIQRCFEAVNLIGKLPPSQTMVDTWFTLGWVYYYLSDHPTALNYGLKALNLAQELGDREREAWALDAIASFDDDPFQATHMHEAAFNIFKEIEHVEGQFRVLNNWACALFDQGNFESALKTARAGMQLVKEQSLLREEINLNETIGSVLIAMGDYEQALECLQYAKILSDRYGPDIVYVWILVALGQVYLMKNDLEKAKHQLFQALKTATEWNINSEKMRCHQYLSELYEKQGKPEKALEHYKLFHSLKEIVAGESSARQIAMLKMAHKVETTQRDAEIQRLQNEKLKLEIDEHKRIQAILENLATRDSLTNLNNRRHFLILAEKEWQRALRYKHPFTVLMLDLDHFKQINDRYGHSIGDQALISVAGIIQAALRASEIAGRYGGDEFAIILPETTAKNGLLVSKRIRKEIIGQAIQTERRPITLTASIGVAGLSDENRNSIQALDTLLNRADKALYEAKRAGKNQTYLYPDEE